MSERACVVFDERLTSYNFGPSHPMAPVRIELTMSWPGSSASSTVWTSSGADAAIRTTST